MPFLRYSSPSTGVKYVPLEREVVTIGRGKECDLVLEDTVASRKHCQVRRWAGSFLLEDLKSKNGTYVNGNKVASHTLKDGDLISVGESQLVFKLQK